MKKQSSATARGIAMLRAIEMQKSQESRICCDPFAHQMVGCVPIFFGKLIINTGLYDLFGPPGLIPFIAAREQYIDDFLKTCLSEGFEQIVILGAGFDTRAYRLTGIEKAKVFEIDHVCVQTYKLKRLKKVIDPIPNHVTFVPVDFETQTLGEHLPANGYNKLGKTLFIWQGVTMYLTPEGVNSTLSFITEHSGPGSTVIFDYFYSETLSRFNMMFAHLVTKIVGESLIFGINEDQIESFLVQRGFCDVRNASNEELKRLYLTGSNSGQKIKIGAAVVSARVNHSANNISTPKAYRTN